MLRVYREYERRKAERGEIDFEDLLELAVRLFDGDDRCAGGVPGPVPRVHRRRVPGRQPAPAGAARSLARRPRRPLRRRRRLPVDLRLHRRLAALAARLPRPAFPRRRSSGSRTTTARRPRCSSSRTGSSRGSAEPRRCCDPRSARARAGRARLLHGRGGERLAGRRARRASGARALPLEEIAMLCRTNARLADFEEVLHEAGIPFQGSSLLEREAARRLLRLLAREQSTAVSSRVRSLAEEAGLLTSLPDEARRARARPPGRPGTPRPPRGGARRRRADLCRLRGRASRPVRSGRRGCTRRPPRHLSPGQGARVRRRSSCRGSTTRSFRRVSRGRTPTSTRSVGCSTSGSRVPSGHSP